MTAPDYRARPGAPPPGTVLCRLDEIANPGAKGFTFGSGSALFDMFLVRKDGAVYGYVNECPHALMPLETFPDRFLTLDAERIVCSTHGAMFRPEDGFCTRGPCDGKSLISIPLAISDGIVKLAD